MQEMREVALLLNDMVAAGVVSEYAEWERFRARFLAS